ncbi:hypothetical protein [Streptomyces sp. NPDC093223]|uniref:hypothetical protein n=1 Tax=Streptomyces sp. NPDC093223 TaxID=3366033 RepID=UPI0038060C89
MVVTDGEGHVLFCSPAKPGSCADITHARHLGPVRLLADGPAAEILADWYEEIHQRRRKAHSSRRIRVEHGIARLKNWRWPATSAAAST